MNIPGDDSDAPTVEENFASLDATQFSSSVRLAASVEADHPSPSGSEAASEVVNESFAPPSEVRELKEKPIECVREILDEVLSQTCLELARDESNNTYVKAEQLSLSKVVSLDESYTPNTEHREPQVTCIPKKKCFVLSNTTTASTKTIMKIKRKHE